MEPSSLAPDFNNQYVVFSHGTRLIEDGESSVRLGPDYRIVTVHIPSRKINDNLVRILLNQISSKIGLINGLFSIGCPIARQAVRENLENCFIIDWLVQRHPDPINKDKLENDLLEIGDDDLSIDQITNNSQIKDYLLPRLTHIKTRLGFEIRTYRPNEMAPKLFLDFNFTSRLTNVKSGIFKAKDFDGFDFDKTDELNLISSISSVVEESPIKSIVNFNKSYSYLFDRSTLHAGERSFFDTIKPKINSGLIVIVSCGCYDGKITRELRSASVERQKAPYLRKYKINYE
jgi:hypothetical protein